MVGILLALVGLTLVRPAVSPAPASAGAVAKSDVTLRLSEDYLNYLVAQEAAPYAGQGLSQARVDVKPNQAADVHVSGRIGLGALSLSSDVVLKSHLGVQSGRIVVSTIGIQVGALALSVDSLPRSVQEVLANADRAISQAVENAAKTNGLVVNQVSTDEDGITVGLVREG
ncbi:MAG: hypothetical protein HYX94_05365 [Chloroflexi bacterium]|nr:hypothetical protein [Chloroflexota bacterium]